MQHLAVLSVLCFTSMAHAALPPGSYDKLRIEAQEAVTIVVQSAKVVEAGNSKHVTIEAKVLGVERSKAGLKKGDKITIKYSVPSVAMPGPVPTPILEADGFYPAFLNKSGSDYVPAAHGWSFKMTPEA
jgi:hypothetical protein